MLVPKRVKHRREFRGKMRGEIFFLRFHVCLNWMENC